MPSLFRFLFILAVIGLAGYGLIYVLGTYVRPATRPMSVEVPLKNLGPKSSVDGGAAGSN
jgi:hypothetical protein